MFLLELVLINQSKLSAKCPITNFVSHFFLDYRHTFTLETNLGYLNQNKKARKMLFLEIHLKNVSNVTGLI